MLITSLPSVPPDSIVEYQKVITYSQIASPNFTYALLVVGLPVNYVVCGTCIRVISQFTGSGLSSLTCSLGAFVPNTILSDLTYYCATTEMTQVPSPTSYEISGPPANDLNNTTGSSPVQALYFNGTHDVAAYFISQGVNLNGLSAGAVEVTVQIRPC